VGRSAEHRKPRTQEEIMKPVTIVNSFSIKSGKMDEFIETQRSFTAELKTKQTGFIGGRMYRSLDGKRAVAVNPWESVSAKDEISQSDAWEDHLKKVRPLVESASPSLYEETYTAGDFK
jgi:quinol monooxygenase YgiN